MVRRLEPIPDAPDAASSSSPSPGSRGSVPDAWLDVLVRTLRLPAARRQAIRDELAEHLDERLRDLMVAGEDEETATRIALTELGGAAELARRFRAANRARARRITMNLSLLGLGLTALGVSVFALRSSTAPDPVKASVFQAAEPDPAAAELLEALITVEMRETSIQDAVGYLTAVLGRTVYVHRNQLDDELSDTLIDLEVHDVPARKVLELILEQLDDRDLAWHFGDDLIELGYRSDFDRRAMRLVSYDAGDIFRRLQEQFDLEHADAASQVTELVQELVSPEDWTAYGGDIAQLHVLGDKMFVQAPPRMHEGVAWILAELAGGHRVAAADRGDALTLGERDEASELTRRLTAIRTELRRLEEIYRDDHPMIARLRGEAEQIEERLRRRAPSRPRGAR